jgi:ferric-dicitrate binding protein FerR (iron transport regulator)
LDSLADGILITQANAIIRKQGEKVIIDPQDGLEEQPEPDAVAAYNVLEIPKGRQYEMVLPDGSQVWLNAASTLSFPPAFSSGERRVKITGEAYFEVAKNADKPFRVLATQMGGNSSNGTLVEVLGTHFNINAYEDEEAMKTTLLEGSVRIMTAGDSLAAAPKASVLTPGEQAEIQHTQTAAIDVKKVDVEEVVAWKSNVFNFNNTDLQTIMRQIARWYDVEVVYQGRIPVRYFSGKIKRTIPLSAVLEILEQSNIRFKLKGEQIVVKS